MAALSDITVIASFPGSHHRVAGSANLLVGNPETRDNFDTGDLPDAPSWNATPDITWAADARTRLVVVQASISVELVMTFTGEDPADQVVTPIDCPNGGQVCYSVLLSAGATGMYLRNP